MFSAYHSFCASLGIPLHFHAHGHPREPASHQTVPRGKQFRNLQSGSMLVAERLVIFPKQCEEMINPPCFCRQARTSRRCLVSPREFGRSEAERSQQTWAGPRVRNQLLEHLLGIFVLGELVRLVLCTLLLSFSTSKSMQQPANKQPNQLSNK